MDSPPNIIIEILSLEGVVPIMGTLLGSIGGGLSAYILSRSQHKKNRQLALDNIAINKLEVIYSTILDIEVHYLFIMGRAAHLLLPLGQVDAFLKSNDEEQKRDVIPFGELEMLIALYAPEKLPLAKAFINDAQSFSGGVCIAELDYENKSDETRASEWEGLKQQYEKALETMSKLKIAIQSQMNAILNK